MITRTGVRAIAALFSTLLVITSFPANTFAQTTNDVLPVAYVDRVDVNEIPVKQGEELTGSFVVSNGGDVPLNDVQYRISLTGMYENGLPTEFYDTVVGEHTFDVAVGESASVPFTYMPPASVAGTGLGIEIELFLSTGASLGWNHTPITISGTNAFLTLSKALIQKGGEAFTLDFGPTFTESEQPQLAITLVQNGDTDQRVTPQATFSVFQNRDVPIHTESYDSFVVAAGATVTKTFDLPTFDRAAGVYFGTLTLVDDAGVSVAPTIPFQYIIDGDIATVQSVSFDETNLDAGDSVKVSIRMTGKPFAQEIVDDVLESTLDGYTFELTLKNEHGAVVATYLEALDKFDESLPKEVVLQVTKPVVYPVAEVVLKKGDTIVTTYETNIPDWVVVPQPDPISVTLLALYAMLLMALVTMIVLFAIKRDRRFTVVLFAIIIVALTVFICLQTGGPRFARAAVEVVSFTQEEIATGRCTNARGVGQGCGRVGRVWSLIPGVTINRPASIDDDGTVTLTGNMTFDSCGNSPNSRHIWQIGEGGVLTKLDNLDTSAMGKSGFDSRGHWFNGSKRFSIRPQVAESCGVQTINLRFVNCVAGECGFRQKRVTLDLGPCDQCPNLPGSQREVPGGYRLDESTGQCMLTDDFQVLCSPSQNPITPGSDVTFTASTFNAEGDVQFTWYSARNGGGDVIKNETNGSRSRLTRRYDTEGMYHVSVRGRDENGASFTRTCGVMVRDPNADPDELVDTDGDGIPDTSVRDLSNPLAPPPVLSLTIDKTLTNDTCTLTWTAQHVTQCFLVNATGGSEPATVTGSKPVVPGTYFLRCLAVRDGSVAETDPVTCRLNPGIREI